MLDVGTLTEADFRAPARIQLVFTDNPDTYDRGTTLQRPLVEAIRLVAQGEPGFDYSGALILYGDHTISAAEAKQMAKDPRLPI